MSCQAGLTGAVLLDPSVCSTAEVGTNGEQATNWDRAQLPSGNLSDANEVADAINNSQGLVGCNNDDDSDSDSDN